MHVEGAARAAATMHTDHLLRRIFGKPQNAASWLRWCLRDHPVSHEVDWSTLQVARAVRVDGALRRHEADFVFLASSHDGSKWFLFVVEHTSGRRRRVGKQVLRYVLQALSNWDEEHPGLPRPVILPMLLHTGLRPLADQTWLASASTPTRIGRDNAGFAYGILVDELATATEAELSVREIAAPCRLAFLFAQFVSRREPEDIEAALRRWHPLLLELVHPPFDPSDLEVFQSYVLETTSMTPEHLARVLRELLGDDKDTHMQTTADRLRAEGRIEGKAEGQAELLLRLLDQRFGRRAEAFSARIRTASLAELDRWALRIFPSQTLDDVFAE